MPFRIRNVGSLLMIKHTTDQSHLVWVRNVPSNSDWLAGHDCRHKSVICTYTKNKSGRSGQQLKRQLQTDFTHTFPTFIVINPTRRCRLQVI